MRYNSQLFSRHLDTVGDGSGTKNAVGNYAITSQDFIIAPSSEQIFSVARMLITLEDTSGMQAEEYGNLGAALTNGICIAEYDSAGLVSKLCDDVPVKTNAGWARLCYDANVLSWGTTPTDELLTVRWTFSKFGAPLVLRGDEGGKLVVTLNDSFTGLISHYFMVQGFIQRYDLP